MNNAIYLTIGVIGCCCGNCRTPVARALMVVCYYTMHAKCNWCALGVAGERRQNSPSNVACGKYLRHRQLSWLRVDDTL